MEIILDLLKMVLQYLGMDEDQIEVLLRRQRRRGRNRTIVRRFASEITSYNFKLFTKRSLVREIGSRLPLKPCRRPHLQLTYGTSADPSTSFTEKPRSQLLMMTLADIGWLADMEDSFQTQKLQTTEGHNEVQNTRNNLSKDVNSDSEANAAAMEKISALEGELERLKAQIAMLVQCPPQPQVAFNSMPMTSTPCTPVASLPPPPPPPPPPPMTPCNTPIKSVAQIIKENKAKNGKSSGPLSEKPACAINMAEVLKGLNQVKLRTVERSPGGTPIRPKALPTEGNDPASIIARALKKKFSHNLSPSNSEDKENSPMSSFPPTSPSPQKAPFGPHLLKGAKSRRRSSTSSRRRSSLSRPALSPIN